MCNCGNKRNTFARPLSGTVASERTPSAMWQDVNFEYIGKSGLTVTGGVTGRKYRFNHPGDVQLIDYRDASGMSAIPNLKKVRKNEQ
jgi:hypothetical protein